MSGLRKSFKKTNPRQFEKLVELMEANPNMAKGLGQFGSSRKCQKEYWESFAVELNSLGPPAREGKEWHKVWLDYKLKIKKKIASNKKEVTATGGGPSSIISLSPLEKVVDGLLSLQHAIDPPGSTFGVNEDVSVPLTTEQIEIDGEQQNTHVHVTPLPSTSRVRKYNEVREDAKLKILENQTLTQTELLTTAKSIETALLDIARYTRKSYEVEKEKLVLLKAKEERKDKENINKNHRQKENIEIQLRKLEVKSLKYKNFD